MSTVLYLSMDLEHLETAYLNLDGYVIDIVNGQWKSNQFELWYNGSLVRHRIDNETTEFYITKDGQCKLNTYLYIEDEIDNIERFVASVKINDFMINSHMENMMFDACIITHKLM
ncbi:hypothetical protein D7X33_26570 [Butyricicoccus sp. 1XD8-22]|nr:hypothetical protein D7X33_26570 [Butyricicoccus sp. 1XD8-22]